MDVRCVWEHNGSDTLLYAASHPGAFTRGANLEEAIGKIPQEIESWHRWCGSPAPAVIEVEISQNQVSELAIRDADSDVLFEEEKLPLTLDEYQSLKQLALKSAQDFQTLFDSIPQKDTTVLPARTTFYGPVPRTAEEMYRHTKSVNAYYFAEIDVDADNEGSILSCRQRGFSALEEKPDFLSNPVIPGSYGENWTVRKVLRRFLWHDRIHAKAMYRMAIRTFGPRSVPDVFHFDTQTSTSQRIL